MQFSVKFTARLLAVVCGLLAGIGGKPVMLEKELSDRQVTQSPETDRMANGELDDEKNMNSLDLKPTDRIAGFLATVASALLPEVVGSLMQSVSLPSVGGILGKFTRGFGSIKVKQTTPEDTTVKRMRIEKDAREWVENNLLSAMQLLDDDMEIVSKTLDNGKAKLREKPRTKAREGLLVNFGQVELELDEVQLDLVSTIEYLKKSSGEAENQTLDEMIDDPENMAEIAKWIAQNPLEVVAAAKNQLENMKNLDEETKAEFLKDMDDAKKFLQDLLNLNEAAKADRIKREKEIEDKLDGIKKKTTKNGNTAPNSNNSRRTSRRSVGG